MSDEPPLTTNPSYAARLGEIFLAFSKLGLISFGGPIAHLSYLRAEFVSKRHWLTDDAYADLVALCQFLPGPASSQVVFALGMQRAGVTGGMVASLCFTLPSAILMIAFGYGVSTLGTLNDAGWLHGLKLAAVAVVAQAVWGMGRNLCPDRTRLSLCAAAAAVLLAAPGAYVQIAVITLGAVAGWYAYGNEPVASPDTPQRGGWRTHVAAASALVLFFVLLLTLPLVARTSGQRQAAVFDSFYRAGALVFGGGHVVLPLLRAEVVPPGWISDDQFLAGYGAAQAVPGPLFTFSAYLGTVMSPGRWAWANGLWCLLAIFLPAWLLIGGALPFWHGLRAKRWVQAMLKGANASVVGVLLAALYTPVIHEAVHRPADAGAAIVAFGLLCWWRTPPWMVVALMAAAGQYLLLP